MHIEGLDGKVVLLIHVQGSNRKRVLAVNQPRRIELVGSDTPPNVVTLALRLGVPGDVGVSPILFAHNCHAGHHSWPISSHVAENPEI
jgi:hypothetical protein